MTEYLVETHSEREIFQCDSPEEAVLCFFHLHPELTISEPKARVYVADYLGKFQQTTIITRDPPLPPPRITRPDRG